MGELGDWRSACHCPGLQPPWSWHHGQTSPLPQRALDFWLVVLQIPDRWWLVSLLFLWNISLVTFSVRVWSYSYKLIVLRICGCCHCGRCRLLVHLWWGGSSGHLLPAGEKYLHQFMSLRKPQMIICYMCSCLFHVMNFPSFCSLTSCSAMRRMRTSPALSVRCLRLLHPWPWPCLSWSQLRCATPSTGYVLYLQF